MEHVVVNLLLVKYQILTLPLMIVPSSRHRWLGPESLTLSLLQESVFHLWTFSDFFVFVYSPWSCHPIGRIQPDSVSNTWGSWQHLATCAFSHKLSCVAQQFGNPLQITNPPGHPAPRSGRGKGPGKELSKTPCPQTFLKIPLLVFVVQDTIYGCGILAWDDISFILDSSVGELITKLLTFWFQIFHSTRIRGQQWQWWFDGNKLCVTNDFQIKQDKKNKDTYIRTLAPIVCLW